jgi:hypothetical protein
VRSLQTPAINGAVAVTVLAMILGCAVGRESSSLSRQKAVSLADAEAIRYYHVNLRYYNRSPVFHDAKERRWVVCYQRKGINTGAFAIHVDDNTKKAAVVLN